jgi:hypothetical protein
MWITYESLEEATTRHADGDGYVILEGFGGDPFRNWLVTDCGTAIDLLSDHIERSIATDLVEVKWVVRQKDILVINDKG